MNPIVLTAMVATVALQPVGNVLVFPDRSASAATRPAAPLGDPSAWLSAADFGPVAFGPMPQLVLFLELTVDPAGRVTDCRPRPQSDPADPALVALACALIARRGRFGYAIDADGRPSADTVRLSIWLEPSRAGGYRAPPPAPPAPPPAGYGATRPQPRDPGALTLPADRALFPRDLARVLLDLDAKGRVTRCQLLAGVGSDGGDAALCHRLRATRFEPSRRDGRKVPYPGLVVSLTR